MEVPKFNVAKQKVSVEELHINFTKKQVQGRLGAVRYIDKDTKQHILYMPSLDISGYGETQAKAWKMLKFCIEDFFTHLLGHKQSEVNKALKALGWEKSFLFHKEFSRAYVDNEGQLQNLNAEENTIEQVSVTAA